MVKKRHQYLIGPELTELVGAKLPSRRQVLSLLLNKHLSHGKTLHQSAKEVSIEVKVLWDRAKIPTMDVKNVIPKLLKLHKHWRNLSKSRGRGNESKKVQAGSASTKTLVGVVQKKKEDEFKSCDEDLFDIATKTALQDMTIEEDRQFLILQRQKGRPGCMSGIDHNYVRQTERKEKRAQADLRRHLLSKRENKEFCDKAVLESSGESDTGDSVSSGEEFKVKGSVRPSTSKPKNILTPDLVGALDRTKTTNRAAACIIAAYAQGTGEECSGLGLNEATLRHHRNRIRESLAVDIKNNFKPTRPLVVHWDGKLLPDIVKNAASQPSVGRLPVIVSEGKTDRILKVPKLQRGTGQEQAKAVAETLKEWGLVEKVCAMCFDTTSSNTGEKSGACVLLERLLGEEGNKKLMLHLACRHHVMEIVLSGVFASCIGLSKSPDIAIFVRLRTAWGDIDKQKYTTASMSKTVREALGDSVDESITFALQFLKDGQPRDDYRELPELAIIFLGGVPPRGIHFQAPGAVHSALWMGRAIYSFKEWIFQDQLKLTRRELQGLERVCVFVVRVYLKAWFTAPFAVCAPRYDLLLMKDLIKYKIVDAEISAVAVAKFSRHLWYLGEQLIGLAFLDPEVTLENKWKMVAALDREGAEEPAKRLKLSVAQLASFPDRQLDDFVTRNTRQFFTALTLTSDFLCEDPEKWPDINDYKYAQEVAKYLRVVNDCAERGVALIKEYNSKLTHDEEEKQLLLRVVADHRKQVPDFRKSTLINPKK